MPPHRVCAGPSDKGSGPARGAPLYLQFESSQLTAMRDSRRDSGPLDTRAREHRELVRLAVGIRRTGQLGKPASCRFARLIGGIRVTEAEGMGRAPWAPIRPHVSVQLPGTTYPSTPWSSHGPGSGRHAPEHTVGMCPNAGCRKPWFRQRGRTHGDGRERLMRGRQSGAR